MLLCDGDRHVGFLWIKGLSLLKDLGGQGCALVGNPQYYQQSGFRNIPGLLHEDVPQEVFFALPFNKKYPRGLSYFTKDFQQRANRLIRINFLR